jgi:2-polyprenyl-3-methyl-5-hydroxy-6-metoxy-1,4-benzoquinol methylase
VTGWRSTFRDEVLPTLRNVPPNRVPAVLDLGCGGGDLARSIARWAADAGRAVDVLGIDPDERAMRVARPTETRSLSFRSASSADLVRAGERFDVIVSNHVLHHLSDVERNDFLRDSEALLAPGGRVVHSDIRRSSAAYAAYASASWAISLGTFVRIDGLRSIERSFTVAELADAVPPGWRVLGKAPHRVLAVFDGSGDERSEGVSLR